MSNAKYWCAILYPESMIDSWESKISDLLQYPYCYCIHDNDIDSESHERKVHIHLIIAFSNTTTYNHALQVISQLQPSLKTVKRVINIRYMYNYLIHDTESAIKDGKFKYSPSDRICGNNFDIGCYEQISQLDKRNMAMELAQYIVDNGFKTFTSFYQFMIQEFSPEYFDIVLSYSGFFERLTRGNYQRDS